MKQRNGDLIRMFSGGEFDLIVHGCNCFHTMGAGIAGTIAKQFPYAAKVDRECTAYGDITKLSKSMKNAHPRRRFVNAVAPGVSLGGQFRHPVFVYDTRGRHAEGLGDALVQLRARHRAGPALESSRLHDPTPRRKPGDGFRRE